MFNSQNSTSLHGFTVFEFIIVLILTGILAFAVYQTVDPGEQQSKQRDERYKINAQYLIESLQKYYKQYEKLPWQTQDSSLLAWTYLTDPRVGMDSISQIGGLPAEFKTNEEIVIGKSEQTKDQVYVCFVPNSKTFRLNWVDLKDIRLGEKINNDAEPKDCPSQPDWDRSMCYYCVSGKILP